MLRRSILVVVVAVNDDMQRKASFNWSYRVVVAWFLSRSYTFQPHRYLLLLLLVHTISLYRVVSLAASGIVEIFLFFFLCLFVCRIAARQSDLFSSFPSLFLSALSLARLSVKSSPSLSFFIFFLFFYLGSGKTIFLLARDAGDVLLFSIAIKYDTSASTAWVDWKKKVKVCNNVVVSDNSRLTSRSAILF